MRFHCVNDNVPFESVSLLRSACEARAVEFVEIDARSFDYADHRQLQRGDLLYRPAVSMPAIRVEQFLFNTGVSSFYSHPASIFFDPTNSPLLFQRAGLPIPKSVYCSTTEREVLRGYVDLLGGFPLVLKMSGFANGIGVMRIDSFPTLFSLLDYALFEGRNPLLSAYVEEAVHWRAIVIGDKVATVYKNSPDEDDFRTHVEDDVDNFNQDIKPELAAIAVNAVKLLGTEFGGVDILEDTQGALYLLESNFPCYFAHPQEVAGIDVSGLMLEHLIAKARRLEAEATSPLAGHLLGN